MKNKKTSPKRAIKSTVKITDLGKASKLTLGGGCCYYEGGLSVGAYPPK